MANFPPLAYKSDNIFEEVLNETLFGLEAWCVEFNGFCLTFFWYLKYIFVFILLSIGISTLLRLRGIYFQIRPSNKELSRVKMSHIDKARIGLGTFYIVFAIGILFNFMTYFLIYVLDPLPDRLIFNFLNFGGYIDPFYMNRIEDLDAAQYPHEKTIYYCVAMCSFIAILDIVISVWYMINNNRFNPKIMMTLLIGGVTNGILTGFTTCLPFFL